MRFISWTQFSFIKSNNDNKAKVDVQEQQSRTFSIPGIKADGEPWGTLAYWE